MARRKRITYRPNKASGALSGVVGGIFVLIGLFVVIPTFGMFGLLWTLIAVAITVSSLYQSFGKGYVGPEIHIEEEDGERFSAAGDDHEHIRAVGLDTEKRLEQLVRLKEAGLITKEEYDQKRAEILSRL